jgi:hypothetical protein
VSGPGGSERHGVRQQATSRGPAGEDPAELHRVHREFLALGACGLATQQVSNDTGGDRWRNLVYPAVDMFVAAHLSASPQDGRR